jgi:phosphate-selective porin
MKRMSFLAVAGLLALPLSAVAEDGTPGKIHYKDGTQVVFGDEFDLKMNLQMINTLTYGDVDQDAGVDEDFISNDVRSARLILSGNGLGDQISYRVEEEFAGESSTKRDAWLQWNADEAAHVRMGTYKQPYSRQELVADTAQQFIDRSIASDFFSPSRHEGAMVHGSLEDVANYYISLYNGESTGEGLNQGGNDNKVAFAAMINTLFGDYGPRNVEGDPFDTPDGAGTLGAAVTYGEGTFAEVGDFDQTRANVDAAARYQGFSLQSEYYYENIDIDGLEDEAKTHGFYVQSGYFIVPKEWELAGRFALIAPDDDTRDIDDIYEYSGVLGYYVNGHNLKLQLGITGEDVNFQEGTGTDTTNILYQFQVVGLL